MGIIKSLSKSLREAITNNPDVRRHAAQHPRLVQFIRRRFDKTVFTGRPLTILGVAFLYILLLFAGIINDVITSSIIVSVDTRASNLFIAVRDPAAVRMFLWITLLASGTTIVTFMLLASVVLWRLHQRWQIAAIWLTLAGAEVFVQLGKLVFHRPRPPGAAYVEHMASFPSGHAVASVVFYGFLVYLCWHATLQRKYKWLALVVGLATIVAVGYSRVYLGVHYVSDVWAGYLVGLLWLILGISVVEWERRRGAKVTTSATLPRHRRAIMAITLTLGATAYVVYGLNYNPSLNSPLAGREYHMATDVVHAFEAYHLPRVTETISGIPQEPLSFLVLARGDSEFTARFERARWLLADPVSLHSTIRLFNTALFNHPYDRAPMTPSFWNGFPNTFSFEKATVMRTARQRHHARFWKTDFCTDGGDNVYAGTASFDSGLKWFITHHISPDIDMDRDLLFHDLQAADSEITVEKIMFAGPMAGQNFAGDPFFTDGQAYALQFNGKPF